MFIQKSYEMSYHNQPKFSTDMSGQTVQTQNRLLLESDQGLHCLQFQPHFLDPNYPVVKQNCSVLGFEASAWPSG